MTAGDFQTAMAAFQRAHDLEPKRRTYLRSWSRAAEQRVAVCTQTAGTRLSERQLAPALVAVDEALSISAPAARTTSRSAASPDTGDEKIDAACGIPESAHPHGVAPFIMVDVAALRKLRDDIVAAVAHATAQVRQAEQLLAQQQWDEAVRVARQACAQDRSSTDAAALCRRATDCAIAFHVGNAEEQLHREEWDACTRECRLVMSYDADNLTATNLIKTADDRKQSRNFSQDGKHLLDAGRFAEALAALDNAFVLWADQPGLGATRERAQTQAATALLNEAEALIRQNRWELAWLRCVAAQASSPAQRSRAAALCASAADEIRKRLAYNLGILPSTREAADDPVVKHVLAAMTQMLLRIKPAHVGLVDRVNFADVLVEHDLASAGITDRLRLRALSDRLNGADLFLVLDGSAETFDRQETVDQGSQSYVAGTKMVPNPAYASAQYEVAQAEARVANCRQSLAAFDAMQGLYRQESQQSAAFAQVMRQGYVSNLIQAEHAHQAAVIQLQSTPQVVPMDDVRTYTYPVYRTQRVVKTTLRMRLVDVPTGTLLWSDALEASAEASDTHFDAAPQFGVAGKRPMLPPSEQLRRHALDQLSPALQGIARDLLRRRLQALEARMAQAPPSGDERIDVVVNCLFEAGVPGAFPQADHLLAETLTPHLAVTRIEAGKQLAWQSIAAK